MFAITTSPVVVLVLNEFNFNSLDRDIVDMIKTAFMDKVEWRRERFDTSFVNNVYYCI